MTPARPPIVDDPQDLSPQWLEAALAASGLDVRVAAVRTEPVGTGLEHVGPALGVIRGVGDAEGAEYAAGLVDRGGDVVHLQVEEDVVAEAHECADGVGAGGGEQLESDLGRPEPRRQRLAEPNGFDEIVDVECDAELVAEFVGNLGHAVLPSLACESWG